PGRSRRVLRDQGALVLTVIDPFLPALDQAGLIRRGDIHPMELVELYLDRIEAHDPALNAYWLITHELAREQARDAAPPGDGHLAGVPVSVKDLLAMSGYPTTYGSRAFANFKTGYDQYAVARLKAEGVPILGKTTTAEFGSRPVTEFGLHGITRNPWNP